MEFSDEMRSIWIKHILDSIDRGYVKRVISRLKRWQGKGQKSVLNLSKYLLRFQDAVHYPSHQTRTRSVRLTQALAKPQSKERQSKSVTLFRTVNQAFVLQSRDRSLERAPSGQVMLVNVISTLRLVGRV